MYCTTWGWNPDDSLRRSKAVGLEVAGRCPSSEKHSARDNRLCIASALKKIKQRSIKAKTAISKQCFCDILNLEIIWWRLLSLFLLNLTEWVLFSKAMRSLSASRLALSSSLRRRASIFFLEWELYCISPANSYTSCAFLVSASCTCTSTTSAPDIRWDQTVDTGPLVPRLWLGPLPEQTSSNRNLFVLFGLFF